MKIRLVLLCLTCMLFSGCTKQSEEIEESIRIRRTDESEYDILNDGLASSRNFTVKTADLIHAEKQMLKISQEFFSTQDVILSPKRFLDQDALENLLASSSSSALGLNMAKEAVLQDESRELPAMRNIVSNLVELDFISRKDPDRTAGVVLCLLVNTKVKDYEGNAYELALQTAKAYAETSAKKLVKNLRKTEELKEVPILILLYSLKSEDESLPGAMISKAFCQNEKLDFQDLDEKWLIFPSAAAKQEDPENSMRIQALKEAVSSYTKETVTIFAKGHYIDEEADELKVIVQSYSGSYQFNWGLVQTLANQCDEFGSLKLKLMIEIQYYDDVIFTICKQSQQEECSILDLS